MDARTAHARCILQDLTRQIADSVDSEIIDTIEPGDADAFIIGVSHTQPVNTGTARADLNNFLLHFADAYLSECPDARRAPHGPCKTCGAKDTFYHTDHLLLDYGHAFQEAMTHAGKNWERTIFAAPRLQPILTAAV